MDGDVEAGETSLKIGDREIPIYAVVPKRALSPARVVRFLELLGQRMGALR